MKDFEDTSEPLFSWHTSEMVCPYCGFIHSNSDELSNDSGEFECENCGKEFFYEREVEVTYDTRKLED